MKITAEADKTQKLVAHHSMAEDWLLGETSKADRPLAARGTSPAGASLWADGTLNAGGESAAGLRLMADGPPAVTGALASDAVFCAKGTLNAS